jgi:hypothetical protein
MGQIFSWTPAEWGEIEVDVRDKGTNHLADASSGTRTHLAYGRGGMTQ